MDNKNVSTDPHIEVIETEIWETVPEKPGNVRVVRNKTVQEVYDEVVLFLKQRNLYDKLDYFLASFDIAESDFPEWHWIACYAVVGGSEGHYVHVDAISSKGLQHIFTAKTFEGFEHALEVSNMLARAFWDELRSFDKLPNQTSSMVGRRYLNVSN